MHRVLAVLIAVCLAGASAASDKKPAEKTDKKKEPEKVYTNADLKKMFGESKTASPAAGSTAKKPAAKPGVEEDPNALPDPLTWLNKRLKDEEQHRKAVAAAEKRVEGLKEQIETIEAEMAQLKLNYVPPTIGKRQTDRYPRRRPGDQRLEHMRGAYLDAEERLRGTQETLAAAEKELADLKRKAPYGPR